MKKGVTIALSGVDGSGKSIQVKMLSDYLRDQGKRVVIIQVFNYFLLRGLINLAKKQYSTSKSTDINKSAFLKLWFIPAMVDFWLLYIFKILPLKKKYDYVIADRYFIDLAVSLSYRNYLPRRLFLYFVNMLPKADTQILLLPNSYEAFKRSKEFEKTYYVDQSNIYSLISRTNNQIFTLKEGGVQVINSCIKEMLKYK